MSTKEKKVLFFLVNFQCIFFLRKKNQLDLFTVHRWENVLPLKLHNNYDIKVNRNAFFVTPMECWTSLNSNVMIFIVSSKQKLNIKNQILARNPANFWFDLFRIRYLGQNFFSFKSYHHQKSENSVRGCSLLEGRTCRPSDDDWVAFSNFYSSNSKTLPLEKNIFL